MQEKITNPPKEKGQSMVELAISLTFLLILIAGVIDFGRAFYAYIAVRDAAQEGAAFAAVARPDNGDVVSCDLIIARVQSTSDFLQGWSDAGEIAVTTRINGTPCPAGNNIPAATCLGNVVEVQVEFANFPLTTPFLGTILGTQSISLGATATDTILTPACQ